MAFPTIHTRYLGPTNYRGSRVKATTLDNRSVTLSWDDALDSQENHDAAAKALAVKLEWSGEMIRAEGLDAAGYVYAFTRRTFEGGGFGCAETIEISRSAINVEKESK